MKLITSVLLVLCFIACKEEEVKDECEIKQTGKVNFVNFAEQGYDVYINNVFQDFVEKKHSKEYTLNVGSYNFKAISWDETDTMASQIQVAACSNQNLIKQ